MFLSARFTGNRSRTILSILTQHVSFYAREEFTINIPQQTTMPSTQECTHVHVYVYKNENHLLFFIRTKHHRRVGTVR